MFLFYIDTNVNVFNFEFFTSVKICFHTYGAISTYSYGFTVVSYSIYVVNGKRSKWNVVSERTNERIKTSTYAKTHGRTNGPTNTKNAYTRPSL